MDVDFGLSGVNVRLVTVGGNVRRGVEVTIGWIKKLLKNRESRNKMPGLFISMSRKEQGENNNFLKRATDYEKQGKVSLG